MSDAHSDTPKARGGGGLATAALVLGLIGLIPLLGILPAVAAVVLGLVSLLRRLPRSGCALAGTALGAVGATTSIVVTGIALLVSVLMPVLSEARDQARRDTCETNIRSIKVGVRMHEDRHGAPPANLDILVEQELLSREKLRCPAAEGRGYDDYFYHPPADGAPPRTLIACDFRDNHNDRRHVLDYYGRVDWMTEQSFRELLERPENADFARALRKAEGP